MTIAELRDRLHGVMAAPVTPFNKDFSIDWHGIENNVEFLLDADITGVFPCGSIGESSFMEPKEREQVAARTLEIVAERTLVIVGVFDDNMSVTIQLAESARDSGADAVMVKVPHYFGLLSDEVVAFFTRIDRIGVPFIVYNNPSASRHNISLDTLTAISKLKYFVGVKEAGVDAVQFSRLLQHVGGEFPVIAAAEDPLLFNLLAGASACLTATSTFAPSLIWALYRAVERADLIEARRVYDKLWQFRELLRPRSMAGHPAYLTYTKAALELLGLSAGPPRPPLIPLHDEERRNLARVLNQIGLLPTKELPPLKNGLQ